MLKGVGLKEREEEAVDELKRLLEDIRHFDVKKLTSDFYLFQWLKAHGMNAQKTHVTLRNSFNWRQENNVTEANKDFPHDFVNEYPIYDSFAKTGMPVYSLNVDQWDVRTGIDNGDEEKLRRYIYLRTLRGENEWLQHNERELQKRGVEVMYEPETIRFIINAHNVPVQWLAVPRVINSFIGTMKCLSGNFPGCAIELIFINFSSFYYMTFHIIRPFLNFVAKIQIYNSNKTKWTKVLSEFIDVDQQLKLQSIFGSGSSTLTTRSIQLLQQG